MFTRPLHLLLLAIICSSLAQPARALIMTGRGNDPVRDQNWRAGAVDVANLKSRIGWWEGPPFGGGMWNFLYRGDTDAFNAALKVFANIRAPSLELIVADGPAESPIMRDDKDPKSDTRYDWEFVIWNVQSYYQLYGNPRATFMPDDPNFRQPLPPPRITVFISAGGPIDWAKVQTPKGIRVIDRRGATAGIRAGEGAVVAGNIFDMATSKPLPDAQVSIEKLKGDGKYEAVGAGKSDEAGRFSIAKLPAGAYRISASAQGYAALVMAYERLVADSYRAFDDVELAPQASMSGTVVDDAGKPVAGASVRADSVISMNGMGYRLPDLAQATTDAQGRFEIPGLPKGFARPFCFTKGLHAPLADIKEVPTAAISIRMSATGAIKGKVVDQAGNVPKGQVAVSANPEGEQIGKWGGSMYAKADGTFEFENVPAGKYIISAHRNPGREPRKEDEKAVIVTGGKTEAVEITVP